MIASVGRDGDWIVNLLRETGVDVDLISVTDDVCPSPSWMYASKF